MSTLDRFLAGVLLVLAALCIAGIVHIVSVLAVPHLVEPDAFARLSKLAAPARMQALPRPKPGSEIFPFSDPAMARGVCLFDLSKAALRVAGTVDPDRLLALSFRTRDGHVFFSMTDRAAIRGEVNVLVLSSSQLEALEASTGQEEEEPVQELRLLAPALEGIVLVEALAALPGEWPRAEEQVARLKCTAEPISEG